MELMEGLVQQNIIPLPQNVFPFHTSQQFHLARCNENVRHFFYVFLITYVRDVE